MPYSPIHNYNLHTWTKSSELYCDKPKLRLSYGARFFIPKRNLYAHGNGLCDRDANGKQFRNLHANAYSLSERHWHL